MIPLKDLIGDVEIQKGESIAFVLKDLSIKDGSYNSLTKRVYDEHMDPGYANFAYIFQKQNNLPVELRYEKNVTIDFVDEDNLALILSGNFLTGEEKYLELFFDTSDDVYDDNNSLDGQFTLLYKIYSAEEKAYIFHSSYYQKDRYEMIYPLNDILPKKPAEGCTVKVTISGTVERPIWSSSDSKTQYKTEFKSEFYDNAYYDDSSYHPLSQSNAQGNDPNIEIGSDGKFPRPFTFARIKAPNTLVENDFRFQCYNEVEKIEETDLIEKLLVIKNFDISVQIQ